MKFEDFLFYCKKKNIAKWWSWPEIGLLCTCQEQMHYPIAAIIEEVSLYTSPIPYNPYMTRTINVCMQHNGHATPNELLTASIQYVCFVNDVNLVAITEITKLAPADWVELLQLLWRSGTLYARCNDLTWMNDYQGDNCLGNPPFTGRLLLLTASNVEFWSVLCCQN